MSEELVMFLLDSKKGGVLLNIRERERERDRKKNAQSSFCSFCLLVDTVQVAHSLLVLVSAAIGTESRLLFTRYTSHPDRDAGHPR